MKKINMNTIAQMVSQLEGGKKELNIAEIKEVLAAVSDLAVGPTGGEVMSAILNNGIRRANKK